ncbi:ABC transporter permease [Sedimenticola selenatireducens]|uniref:ABC transporter permease n=1 Tax=Sedimenticola selenatireducens TaxID=191960 RepID=A0A2N6D133_9GAMM|nr:ABC transporter permease [Sedimenticola selenatireducens]PLX63395.1 MAG: ABC transporter permease [Sedimenticola selenatireducens]
MFDLKGYGGMLLDGLWLTVAVGLSSMLLAVLLGLLGSWGKLSRNRLANFIADTYTTVVRGIPELILLLLVYFGVPTLLQDIAKRLGHDIRIDLDPFLAGTLAIGFIYGAFSTEVFRGAFISIPSGQLEAARAMWMSRILTFRRILLPQSMRFALPGLGNVWMVLLKATALISIIQLDELMRKTKIAANATHQPFTFYLLASIIFLGLTVVSMLLQHRAEKWANRGIAGKP